MPGATSPKNLLNVPPYLQSLVLQAQERQPGEFPVHMLSISQHRHFVLQSSRRPALLSALLGALLGEVPFQLLSSPRMLLAAHLILSECQSDALLGTWFPLRILSNVHTWPPSSSRQSSREGLTRKKSPSFSIRLAEKHLDSIVLVLCPLGTRSQFVSRRRRTAFLASSISLTPSKLLMLRCLTASAICLGNHYQRHVSKSSHNS